jgi:hypothetical protein
MIDIRKVYGNHFIIIRIESTRWCLLSDKRKEIFLDVLPNDDTIRKDYGQSNIQNYLFCAI